jgi:hypothetical protein
MYMYIHSFLCCLLRIPDVDSVRRFRHGVMSRDIHMFVTHCKAMDENTAMERCYYVNFIAVEAVRKEYNGDASFRSLPSTETHQHQTQRD